MDASFHVWTRRIGIPLLVGIIAIFLFPHSGRIIAPLVSVGVWAAATLGYIFIIVGIPFLLWTVGKTVFRTFITPYVRSRRIRAIRERRLLTEAALRGGTGQH